MSIILTLKIGNGNVHVIVTLNLQLRIVRPVGVHGEDRRDLAIHPLRKKRHGFRVERRHEMLFCDRFQVIAHRDGNLDAVGGKCRDRRIKNIKMPFKFRHARILAAKRSHGSSGHDKLPPVLEMDPVLP